MFATLLTVWVLYLGAMVSPGPNILVVTQLAASDRRRSASLAGIGVAVGAGLWATCAVLGIKAIFQAFPWMRLSLQITGGIYLAYVAYSLWRADARENSNVPLRTVAPLVAFRLGFLTNITNPKAALFFSSVFAASFPERPSTVLQISAVAVVVLSALSWYLLLAHLFSRPKVRAAYSRIRMKANRAASFVMGALGLNLLIASFRETRS